MGSNETLAEKKPLSVVEIVTKPKIETFFSGANISNPLSPLPERAPQVPWKEDLLIWIVSHRDGGLLWSQTSSYDLCCKLIDCMKEQMTAGQVECLVWEKRCIQGHR